jgi:putative membrane protein
MSWRGYHNLQGLIMIGWGLFLLDKIDSGRLLLYINRRYVLLIALTAVAFFAVAQSVISNKKKGDPAHDEHDLSDEGEKNESAAHSRPPAFGLLVLALPLLLGVVLPAKTLDSSIVANKGMDTRAPLGQISNAAVTSVSLASDQRSVMDWVGDFNSASDPSAYQNEEADVTGFVYHDVHLAKNQFLVSRFVVTCCVADAIALGMVVDWPGGDQMPDNIWVEVQGPVYVAELDGQKLPGITAHSVKTIQTPDQPYIFP